MQPTNNAFSRRQFLRGQFRRKEESVRPPWALPEADFKNTCTQCNKCIEVCSEKIIVKDEEGFPSINFSLGGCTFCGECIVACKEDAFVAGYKDQKPWNQIVDVSNQCIALQGVACRSCTDSCEEEAISFRLIVGGESQPEINKDSCSGCGFCIAICPVNAIKTSKQMCEESAYGHN